MGEIKSTLDLVMEKTRHLSLSEDEKNSHRQGAYQKRLQGLLQKYTDGSLPLDRFRDKLTKLQAAFETTDMKPLVQALLERIDPDGKNQHWLDLITEMALGMQDQVQEILEKFSAKRDQLRRTYAMSVLNHLKTHHGIHGSAVVPNLILDTEYRNDLSTIRQEIRTNLGALSS